MRPTLLAWIFFVAGCATPSPASLDGATVDTAISCADQACDDGRYCNGTERCQAGACVAGTPPCLAGMVCDEAEDGCTDVCVDEDGDGFRAASCGGDDCDDSDAGVSPAAVEACDSEGVDEDCDPTTYGARDVDDDHYIDAGCCNGTRCGDDCDDRQSAIHPGAGEICNGFDDDCNAAIDEGVGHTYYPDCDGDDSGACTPMPGSALCTPVAAAAPSCTFPTGHPPGCPSGSGSWSMVATDCDDLRPQVRAGMPEVFANGLDDNCDGRWDELYEVTGAIGASGPGPASSTGVYAALRGSITSIATHCSRANEYCVTGGIGP